MIRLCIFGNIPAFQKSLELIYNEAVASRYFFSIDVYTQADIPKEHMNFILTHPRGYGYWIWKAYVILHMMNKYPEGDIILYADAGCGISTSPQARRVFKTWIDDVRKHPSHRLSFQMCFPEEDWTKGELFEYMDCNTDVYRKTGQHSASIQVYLNTPENKTFVQEYFRISTADNYHYVSDEPSRIPNAPSFRDHRHDQSIVSILFKKHGSMRYEDHGNQPDYPISTIRRKFRY
jgi:hypothetical protein